MLLLPECTSVLILAGKIVCFYFLHSILHFHIYWLVLDIKALISGATPISALIIVLSATDTPPPFTALRKHLHVARQSGIKKICIFINKIDLLQESSSTALPIQNDLRALLTEYRFDGARTPIISGSALVALQAGEKRRGNIGETRVGELIKAADSWFDVPSRESHIFVYDLYSSQDG